MNEERVVKGSMTATRNGEGERLRECVLRIPVMKRGQEKRRYIKKRFVFVSERSINLD